MSVHLPCLVVLVYALLWHGDLRGRSRFIKHFIYMSFHLHHVTVEMEPWGRTDFSRPMPV